MILAALKNFIRSIPAAERLARRLLDRRYQIACRYLHGIGLEIGALDRPLMLPKRARAFYLDRLHPARLREHYPELGSRPLFVSVVADGESLSCIADNALDFIVANHVIEHCEDPIAAASVFFRKLKGGGALFMAVPDMRFTFDRNRHETTWEHLVADHERGTQTSRARHYQEWAETVEGRSGADAAQRAQELLQMTYSIHYHCWTRAGFVDFLEHLRAAVPHEITAARSWRNENIFLLTKPL